MPDDLPDDLPDDDPGDRPDDPEARSTRGRLLVATPTPLADPNFDRTVVFMLEHSAEGALGLILNRPSELPVDEPLPPWAGIATAPSVVFVGGPVAPESVIGLVEGTPASGVGTAEGWADVTQGLASVDLSREPDSVGAVEHLRVFGGHSGWAPGQLDVEIEAGGWFVVDATRDDVFSPEPENLWRTVLARQRGRLAWFANAPDDPANN